MAPANPEPFFLRLRLHPRGRRIWHAVPAFFERPGRQAAEKCNKLAKKRRSGAEVESTQFTSALKHRPPEEKDVFRSLLGREPIAGFTPQTFYVVAESDLWRPIFLCQNTF